MMGPYNPAQMAPMAMYMRAPQYAYPGHAMNYMQHPDQFQQSQVCISFSLPSACLSVSFQYFKSFGLVLDIIIGLRELISVYLLLISFVSWVLMMETAATFTAAA
jgi:hypothetical protein